MDWLTPEKCESSPLGFRSRSGGVHTEHAPNRWLQPIDITHGFEMCESPSAFAGAGSRGQHDALDALAVGIGDRAVNWILDADIKGFFDNIDHDWMMRFVEHRVGDRRVLRLIRGWLKAGVMEDGVRQPATKGPPRRAEGAPHARRAVIAPLLANIYLHYAYDLWARQWRKHLVWLFQRLRRRNLGQPRH